jgi:phosphoserine phosphatase RsbU/P
VDDNPSNLEVLMATLGGRGYTLLVAKSGEDALSIARRARPSLILLDILMPGIDGYETCRALKKEPATRNAAVIFLSALDDPKDKVKGLNLGAVDYIAKPFLAEEVIARVETHLTIQRLNCELQARYDEIEHELTVVAQAQKSLLPQQLPDIEGLHLAAYYQTSRYAGGDYYDIIRLGDQQWGIFVADVSGHGTRAAVLMAMTYAFFHAFPHTANDPAVLLDYMNDLLLPVCHGHFVTALYTVYDSARGTINYASSGHMPPLLYRPGTGAQLTLACEPTCPLGVFPYDRINTTQQQLTPGDVIVFYTDGVSERMNSKKELYGVGRLQRMIADSAGQHPAQAVDAVMKDVDTFAEGIPADDDQTVLLGVVG